MVIIAIAEARQVRRARLVWGADGDAITVKSIAAIVRRRASAPPVTERALKAQAAALAKLEAAGISFLPVRFGTVVDDAAELKRLLTPKASELASALKLTKGRRQMTVRVRGPRAKLPRSSGRAYLTARAREMRVPGADPIRRAVSTFIVAETTGPATGPFSGAVYHLIDERDVDAYAAAAATVAQRSRGRFVIAGPMPPFAFTSVAEITGQA